MAEIVKIVDKSKDQGEMAALTVAQLAHEAAGLLQGLEQAAISNPLIGLTTAYISVALAQKIGILDANDALVLKGVVIGAAGLNFAENIAADIGSIADLFGSGQKVSTNILTPSAQVVVFGEKDNAQLNALLQKYLKE